MAPAFVSFVSFVDSSRADPRPMATHLRKQKGKHLMKTTDLCDEHPDVLVAEPVLADFGGAAMFGGRITTLRVFEDNVLVRAALEEPGAGRVLVVDGGGSLRCALVGDLLAAIGQGNGPGRAPRARARRAGPRRRSRARGPAPARRRWPGAAGCARRPRGP